MSEAVSFLIVMFVWLCVYVVVKPDEARGVYEILTEQPECAP